MVPAISRDKLNMRAVKDKIEGRMEADCESMEAFRSCERSTKERKTVVCSPASQSSKNCSDRSGLAKVNLWLAASKLKLSVPHS